MLKINIFIILSIFIKIYLTQNEEESCNDQNCFNCISNSICKWSADSCINSSEKDLNGSWPLKYNQCEHNPSSLQLMEKYCIGINITNIPIIGNLNIINDANSESQLYCKWHINVHKNQEIIIKIILSKESNNNDRYLLQYYYSNNTQFAEFINNDYELISNEITTVTFLYNGRISHTNSPFKFSIEYFNKTSSKEQILIIIGITFGSLLVILGFIALLCDFYNYYQKKIKKKKRLNSNRIITIKDDKLNKNKIPIEFKEENKMKLKAIFKGVPYDIISHSMVKQCLLCMYSFQNNELIVQLKCNDIFHEACLLHGLESLAHNPQCPQCNMVILGRDYDICLKIKPIIEVSDKIKGMTHSSRNSSRHNLENQKFIFMSNPTFNNKNNEVNTRKGMINTRIVSNENAS